MRQRDGGVRLFQDSHAVGMAGSLGYLAIDSDQLARDLKGFGNLAGIQSVVRNSGDQKRKDFFVL